MSTAIEEPPKVETKVEPKIPAERQQVASDFLRPKVQVDGIVSKAPEPEPAKKADEPTKVEDKKPEPPDPRENNLAELRKMRDEARKQHEEATKALETEKAERARIAAEYEEFKKQPAPKEVTERLTTLEQQNSKLDQELRASALERSPSFRKEFNDRINANAKSMLDLMTAAGVEPAEATRAITKWDEDYFASASEGMTAPQKIKFQAAWMQAEQIESDRRAALANADTEWKKREQQQQQEWKVQQEQGLANLKSEQEALFRELGEQEHLKGNPELLKAARESVDASYAMPPKEIMRHIAAARLLSENVKIKDAEITKLKTDYDELKKKHDEAEAFIANQNGGTARISPTDAAEKPEDRKAKAKSFLFPDVRPQ